MPSLLDRVQAQRKAAAAAAATPGAQAPVATHPEAAAPTSTSPTEAKPASADQVEVRRKLRRWLVEKTLGMGPEEDLKDDEPTAARLHERFQTAYKIAGLSLPPDELAALEREVMDELIGFGPIGPLLNDPTVTCVMVNGPNHVFVEQQGHMQETAIQFDDDAHVMRVIERITRPLGRHVDRKWPMVNGRLPDGSRVNAIIPPAAIDGPTITLRKFSKHELTTENLISYGSFTSSMSEFLRACVVARLNMIVSGGTGSGKTTLLNVLSNFIPDHDRVVTIEDSAELQLAKPHVVRLEARPADPDGTGGVTIRDLVANALRMRPERIVVGEVRDDAALDMLQAMNTGHDGSLTTLYANTPRDALSRLETLTAGSEFPVKVIREQIAAAIDVVVQLARLRDGSRKIVQITEVQGMEGDIIVMQDIFRFVEHGIDENGKVTGEFQPLGVRPKFTPRLSAAGITLSSEMFGRDQEPNLARPRLSPR